MIDDCSQVKKGSIEVAFVVNQRIGDIVRGLLTRNLCLNYFYEMMLQRANGKLITILTHILVWVVFGLVVFFRHPVFSGIDISYQLWVTQTVTLSLIIIAFYINSAVLVPRFLLKNRTVFYFLIIIAIVATIVLINALLEAAFPRIINYEVTQMPRPLRRPVLGGHINTLTMIITALVLVIGTSITVMQKWQKDRQAREELEKDKVTSELSFLKAQINPHFFFNTLNNIYALTKVDAEEAGKAIHQLSRMMRYLLYETQYGQTMVSQEIAFVKDYVGLMELRLTDAVKVDLDVPAHLLDMPMAPMILLPFVENAFKHGVSATQHSCIYMKVLQQGSLLDMTIKNSIMKDDSVSLDTSSGIGLANTRRRLDLLYAGKYKLAISELNACNEYTVHLTLDLK